MGPRERQARKRSKTHLVPIVLCSFFGFLVIAVVAFCVGLMGNIEEWLSDLPDYTDTEAYLASEPTKILDADGNVIATFYVENRESVEIDEVSEYVLTGTVDVEDERFYEHNGIDLIAIGRAVLAQLAGESEGASTITQQLVRNTILQDEQFDDTIERKIREMYIAIQIEKIYTKDEILMMYLNTIYYGHGAYGIQAAAQTYFSKDASDLTLAEAALLVGLPNAPSYYDPTSNPEGAIERRNKVLSNMLRLGDITQEEYDEAVATELELNVTETSSTGVNVYAYDYFVEYVKDLLEEEYSSDTLFGGGLTVYTTIDPDIQEAAETAAVENTELYTAYNTSLEVGMTVVDPDTGYILAMVGGLDYDSDESHINHATSRYQPGSSFKMFTLVAAIEAGMDPDISINCDSPITINGYEVQNSGNTDYGTRSLASATAVSSNTAYVQVADAIGNDAIIDMADRLGVDVDNANLEDVTVLTLGTGSLNTVEMACAYGTLANGGYECEGIAISKIESRSGTVLYEYDVDEREQVVDTSVTAAATEVLEGVMTGGTGSSGYPNIDQPVAGKTGTTTDTVSLWFCGYTPQLSVAIVVVNDDNSTLSYYGNLSNGRATLPIFKAFMEEVLADAEREEFPEADEPEYLDDSEWEFAGTIESDESEAEETIELEEEIIEEEVEGETTGSEIESTDSSSSGGSSSSDSSSSGGSSSSDSSSSGGSSSDSSSSGGDSSGGDSSGGESSGTTTESG